MKMETLKNFLKIILLTNYIENVKPVSLLLVGKPESGKSSLVSSITTNKGTIELTDISAYGISKMIIPEIQKGNIIRHIVIPDFLVVLAKSKTTIMRTITFLNALMEEGIMNIGTYLNRGIEFKSSKDVKNARVKCSIITAMTTSMYSDYKNKLNNCGFLSRVLVVKYQYSDDYVKDILQEIFLNKEEIYKNNKIDFPEKKVNIKFDNKQMYKMMISIVQNKIISQKIEAYGFRMTKMFLGILKAVALKNGRTEVTQDDFNEFLDYENLVNYSGKHIIINN